MATGLALVLLDAAATAAMLALAARTGIGDDPGRALAGTLIYGVIYLANGRRPG